MQIDNSYFLSTNPLPIHGTNTNIRTQEVIDADKAAEAFSAMFFEKMLNELQTDNSPITGEKRSSGDVMSSQLMNKHLAEIITKNSGLKDSFSNYIQRTHK